VPIGAHGTAVSVTIVNFALVQWFWYNSVRSVDITSDGGLRFWIGNIEIDIPFDKISSMKKVDITCPSCSIISPALLPHRGFLSNPKDGVAVITSVPSTPFWAWPRSLDKPERTCCSLSCPRLVIVFSPAGGAANFIQEVEGEMRNFHLEGGSSRRATQQLQQPPAYPTKILTSNSNLSATNVNVRPNSSAPTPAFQGDLFDV